MTLTTEMATDRPPPHPAPGIPAPRLLHRVLDGALLAAAAVGASQVVIGVEEAAPEALGALRRALAERAACEPAGIPVDVVATPAGYVSGEESALVRFVNGGPALPTTAPRPFERGVLRRPTLVG